MIHELSDVSRSDVVVLDDMMISLTLAPMLAMRRKLLDLMHYPVNFVLQLRNSVLYPLVLFLVVSVPGLPIFFNRLRTLKMVVSGVIFCSSLRTFIVLVSMHQGLSILHRVMKDLLNLPFQSHETLHHRLHPWLNVPNI